MDDTKNITSCQHATELKDQISVRQLQPFVFVKIKYGALFLKEHILQLDRTWNDVCKLLLDRMAKKLMLHYFYHSTLWRIQSTLTVKS